MIEAAQLGADRMRAIHARDAAADPRLERAALADPRPEAAARLAATGAPVRL